MLSMLLTTLKILGTVILVLLGIILILLLAILFIPVRYRINVHRRKEEEAVVVAKIKASWLLHMLNAAFSYPEAAFIQVRIFCFTVFRTGRETKKTKTPQKKVSSKNNNAEASDRKISTENAEGNRKEPAGKTDHETVEKTAESREETAKESETREKQQEKLQLLQFFHKLWMLLKNIKYTIAKICDKIKHIVQNIQYYMDIIRSDTFKNTWSVCSLQVFSLLKSIRPRKVAGSLLIGTGDPASTGQILAAYGILYPLLGNHINIVPDFEQQIIEGELFIKGKITICRVLKTALIVYINKDLRRLIKLFKREAV